MGMKHQIAVMESIRTDKNTHKTKQKVCMFWKKGKCKYGDQCDYLHADIDEKLPICSFLKKNGFC